MILSLWYFLLKVKYKLLNFVKYSYKHFVYSSTPNYATSYIIDSNIVGAYLKIFKNGLIVKYASICKFSLGFERLFVY